MSKVLSIYTDFQ